MAGSGAAANLLSMMNSCKLFLLKDKTSGAEAGLALVVDMIGGENFTRREDLKFVPWQSLMDVPTSSSSLEDKKFGTKPEKKEFVETCDKEKEAAVKPESEKEALFKPFQLGWHRECIIIPGNGDQQSGRIVQVKYLTPPPVGRVQCLNNQQSIDLFLAKNNPDINLTPENFSFDKAVLGFGWEHETVRQKVGNRFLIQCPVCGQLVSNSLHRHMNRHKAISAPGLADLLDSELDRTPTSNKLKCKKLDKTIEPKKTDSEECPICQPGVILHTSGRLVSLCHLSLHCYHPTQDRKELSQCYVKCRRVDVEESTGPRDQFGDFGPKQVCVHCGLWFTYLDGKLKRHVRNCLKLTKKVISAKLGKKLNKQSVNLKRKLLLSEDGTCQAKLSAGMKTRSDWEKQVSSECAVKHNKVSHSTDTVTSKADQLSGPSPLVKSTCLRLASEIKNSLTGKSSVQPETMLSNAKIHFTMRCHDSLGSRNKARVFNVSIRSGVVMDKGMAAFGRQFGLDHRQLEFTCRGKVLTVAMKASEVEGGTVWVKKRNKNH
eukprot:GFUD01021834.1.p1 GENE.GFUD01021834.1~~GFUD01021834.1.p1  ORF type:complete len:545 (+),score=141.99 GFUD01021834.1:42-1676(+)